MIRTARLRFADLWSLQLAGFAAVVPELRSLDVLLNACLDGGALECATSWVAAQVSLHARSNPQRVLQRVVKAADQLGKIESVLPRRFLLVMSSSTSYLTAVITR